MNSDTSFVVVMLLLSSILVNLWFGASWIHRRGWEKGRIEGRAEKERG